MRIKFTYILLLFIVFTACSTKKNTVITRSYHNLTAHYNVYFNGKESYKKGIKKMNSGLVNDYSNVLPVFPFPNAASSSAASTDMERTIKKCFKTVTLHSITAKPEFKKGIKTKRQKELYNKKQYNNWIDDAYLLMAKANLMKGDYMASTNALRYNLKEFPKENTSDETNLWLVRVLLLKEEYLEAEDILKSLSNKKKMNKKLVPLLNATYADFYIKKKKIPEAIEKLELAVEKVRDKQSKLRYTYILGQLYQQNGQMTKATEKYLKLISMNPPYEMTFSARINLAGTYQTGSAGADQIREQLYKLLKDEKNKEYQDQIYYALGNIDLREGKEDKAIENFKTSANKSTANPRQKARSYLAIADIKYTNKDYLVAQAYYDSAVNNIDEEFPDYVKISSRAKSLKRLANNLNSVSFEDSVQFVAKMSENERTIFIDNIIAKLKEKEAEEMRKQQEEMNEQSQNLAEFNENESRGSITQNISQQGGKWYFYNPPSKSYGISEFQLKWGKRKLEDNWRRLNKKFIASVDNTEETEQNEQTDNANKKTLSNKTREYYTEKLPLTDSLMAVSHSKIRKGLYNAGTIYKDELNEYKLSAKQFNEIINRYPTDPLSAEALYQLYILNRQISNNSVAEENKAALLSKFPESVYAKILTNPNFIKELQEKEAAVDKLYETAYNSYLNGDYSNSLAKSEEGISLYPNHKMIPKFILLKALDKGKLISTEELRKELNIIIKDYPKSEEASASKDIIAMMDVKHPEIKAAEEEVVAKEIYKPVEENEKHFFAMIVASKKADQNQLAFNLINYNLDNYTNSNLTVKTDNIGPNQIVVVKEFKSKAEALNYFDAVSKNSVIIKDVGTGILATFVISETNLATLLKDGSESKYLKFFKNNYNR